MTPPSRSGRLSAIVLPTSLLLVGAFFRFSGLARDQRLHPDEALYADLARRVGIWGDWQLQHVPVDKPPLFFFTNGFFYRLLGDSEFTTRLPNAFASLISLALVFVLARKLIGAAMPALLSLALVIFSPMEIAFASSGFTDTQMVMWLLLALALLSYRRWSGSGLAFGLAIAVKPAALWWLPLLGVFGLILGSPSRKSHVLLVGYWLRGAAIILALISLWDAVSGIGSFWQLGREHYDGGRLIRSDEVLARLEGWWRWLGYVMPSVWLLAVGLGIALVYLLRKSAAPTRRDQIFWAIVGFIIAYGGVHWLIAFNVYDRYLLLIIPLVVLLVAYGAGVVMTKRITRISIFALITAIGLVPAWEAAQGRTPVASDEERHAGIDRLAAVMNARYTGQVFYEHWLGWELRYYLTADPQVFLLYFETPDDLADYALAELPTIPAPRYFVAPKNEAPPWLWIIERRGIRAQAVYDDDRYVIYSLRVP